MEIFCTKKLADRLSIRLEEFGEPEEASRRWDTNIRTIGRRNALVLTHEQTCFAVVLYGVTRRELNRFGSVVRQAIWDTLSAYGVKEAVLRQYLPEEEPITLRAARVENLKILSRIMPPIQATWNLEMIPKPLQIPMMFRYNRHFRDTDRVPADEMMTMLGRLNGQTVVSQRSFLLRASLDLIQYTASRDMP